jgi:hypothetical protein
MRRADSIMANNRLFLVYRPTGAAVLLGKRMGWGWYTKPGINEAIATLFYHIERIDIPDERRIYPAQDDFVLCIEDGEGAPKCESAWQYTNEKIGNLRVLRLSPKPAE